MKQKKKKKFLNWNDYNNYIHAFKRTSEMIS